jgi:hypothetical protein
LPPDRRDDIVEGLAADVLPRTAGRMVKSLGDGQLLEFRGVPAAVGAAFEIRRRMATSGDARESGSARGRNQKEPSTMAKHITRVGFDAVQRCSMPRRPLTST